MNDSGETCPIWRFLCQALLRAWMYENIHQTDVQRKVLRGGGGGGVQKPVQLLLPCAVIFLTRKLATWGVHLM